MLWGGQAWLQIRRDCEYLRPATNLIGWLHLVSSFAQKVTICRLMRKKIGLCGSLFQSADASHPFKQTCSRSAGTALQSWLTGYSHQPSCTSFSCLIRVSNRECVLTEKATFDQRETRRKHHGIHLAILIWSQARLPYSISDGRRG